MTIRQGNKIIAGNINVEDYNTLQNKPQINSVELSGNKTLEELGIQAKGEYATKAQGSKADTAVQPATLDAYLTTESATSTYATKASLSGYATTSALEAKADKETTLAGYGITDGLSTSQITNCIASAPNNIKLELNNGTLTLKAGSKVYDGSGNAININSEITAAITPDTLLLLYTNKSGTQIFYTAATYQAFSGDTQPSTSQTTYAWYDTSEKRVKLYVNSAYYQDLSLPIGTLDTQGTITSFNEFGAMGSTYFLLPGVKFLFANGYNDDRSVKNIEWTSDKVYVITRTWNNGRLQYLFVTSNPSAIGNQRMWFYNHYFIQEDEPSIKSFTVWYKPSARKTYYWGSATSGQQEWFEVPFIMINKDTEVTQKISSFNFRTPFVAVDSNNALWASTASKPSNKSITYSLGASGSKYTISANGWFHLIIISGKANAQATIINNTTGLQSRCLGNDETGLSLITSLPVKAGDSITVNYTATGSAELKLFLDEGAL